MNQNQRKYAMERIDTLKNTLTLKTRQAHIVPAKRLSEDEKIQFIVSGVVKLKSNLKDSLRGNHHILQEIFDFGDMLVHEHISEAGLKRVEEITALAQRAKDAIMLGDSVEALEAIKKFEEEAA